MKHVYELKINNKSLFKGDLIGCYNKMEEIYNPKEMQKFEDESCIINYNTTGYINGEKVEIIREPV